MITINIGLNKSQNYPGVKAGERLAIAEAIKTVSAHFGKSAIKSASAEIRRGSDESTLVLVIDYPGASLDGLLNEVRFYVLATELAQDCVAVQDASGYGLLIGPYASTWGEFNPDYFVQEGSTSLDTVIDSLIDYGNLGK